MEKNTLINLYRNMLLIRLVEEKIADLYSEQEMRCPTHLSIGHEGIAAGVCENLTKKDIVFSNHRSHSHYLAKGGSIKKMLAEIYGKATGCSKGRGGSMHLIDLEKGFLGATPIVASSIPLAAGTAFASKLKNEKNVSISFLGDAAVEEGVFHETLNFSSLHKLPVIFVCENNFYSIFTPLKERQPKREIYKLAEGHGIKTYQGDGNDAIEVHTIMQDALKHVKSGKGPVFLEFKTYRWREHCGPNYDYDTPPRSKKELEEWQEKCPIKRLKEKLVEQNLGKELEKIEKNIVKEIEEAVKFAKESPFPKKEELKNNLYA